MSALEIDFALGLLKALIVIFGALGIVAAVTWAAWDTVTNHNHRKDSNRDPRH